MKKLALLFALLSIAPIFAACGKKANVAEPQLVQMRAICELATVDCYYHNVAKLTEEMENFLWIFERQKHFWIEYSGKVTLGVDTSKISMDVHSNTVTVTLPPAEIFGTQVDFEKFDNDYIIIDKNSEKITAEDQEKALKEAQENMERTAAEDTRMLAYAQKRAERLIESYIKSIGRAAKKEYNIEWIYLEPEQTENK